MAIGMLCISGVCFIFFTNLGLQKNLHLGKWIYNKIDKWTDRNIYKEASPQKN